MSHPYRESANVPVYPILNPPLIEPPYGRTYGCRCCSFGEPIRFGYRSPKLYSDKPFEHIPEIEYAWCLNCLMHYRKILETFEFWTRWQRHDARTMTEFDSVRMVWFTNDNDIATLNHVVQNYHIPLIQSRNQYTERQWLTKPSPTKTFRSRVLSSITRLKKVLGLK